MTAVKPIQPTASPARDQRGYEPSMEEILASIRRIIADDQSLPERFTPPETLLSQADPALITPAQNVAGLRGLTAADGAATRGTPEPSSNDGTEQAIPPSKQEFGATADAPSFAAHGTIAPQFPTPAGPFPLDVPSAKSATSHETAYGTPSSESYPGPPSAQQEGRLRDALRHRDHFHDEAGSASLEQQHIQEPHALTYDTFAPEPSSDHRTGYDEPLGRHEPIPFEATPLISPATDQALTSAFNALAATRLADNTDDLLAMTREMIRPLLKNWLDDNLPSMVERLVRAEIERVARGGR